VSKLARRGLAVGFGSVKLSPSILKGVLRVKKKSVKLAQMKIFLAH
jgi:hypothetical protein